MQFVNQKVNILSSKDVIWLEDAQLIFLIFHTFVCKFGWESKCLDMGHRKKNTPTVTLIAYVVGQYEIQFKMKFLCLLTVVIHGSGIIRVRRQRKLRIKLG